MKKMNFTQSFAPVLLRWVLALMLPLLASQVSMAQYTISACGDAYTDISTTGTLLAGSAGDDTPIGITLGFPFQFYGVTQTTATVGTNGHMQFPGSSLGATSPFTNAACAVGQNAIFPFWDDLNGGAGIYTQTIGTAPNRTFIIQWNKDHFGGTGNTVAFQVRLSETSNLIRFIYQDVDFGNATWNNGASATVGIAGPGGTGVSQFSFNTASLSAGQCILFTPPPPCILTVPANITVSTDPGIC